MDKNLILNRITYGANDQSRKLLAKQGYKAYVKDQLENSSKEDPIVVEKIKEFKLHIHYAARGKKVNEERELNYLKEDFSSLWKKLTKNGVLGQEQRRVADEVWGATWIRILHSKWQLKEILVEFWHNHFNVNVEAHDHISLSFAHYDQEVIRKHSLGNFRVFLEAVAQSPAMLYYLDNIVSQASPANENYARELFELHTLGADNYLNHLYNRWREVPGAEEGKAEGYIDEDVYEAARAFTGWTVANGAHDQKGGEFENTGAFLYFEGWHDNYQKRILGVEFAPNQAPMEDGRKVLDLLAYHKGTARHLCKKLCMRLVSDDPPPSIVDKAVATWIKHQKSEHQIKEVVQTILFSPEFEASLGTKLKRPLELVASFVRSIDLSFTPNKHLVWMMDKMGYYHFRWVTPTGHPDHTAFWLNSNMMLTRWNIILHLLEGSHWHKMTKIEQIQKIPEGKERVDEIVDYWINEILGQALPTDDRQRVMNYLAMGGVEDEPPFGNEKDIQRRLRTVVAMIAMTPTFQYR
ncbi:MAG: DUF1800 domain-containing protein [Saprospiraceae bacterium]|nr:DUF1800 domain-containing protein [Saprospiraceae bacterium]